MGVSQIQIVESIVTVSSAKKSLGWMPECNFIPVKCALKSIVTQLTDTHQIAIVQVSVCMGVESFGREVLEGQAAGMGGVHGSSISDAYL